MTNKMPRLAYQILLGVLMLSFTVVACNNKKSEKKETTTDSSTVKPTDQTQPVDTTKGDTLKKRPTAPGD